MSKRGGNMAPPIPPLRTGGSSTGSGGGMNGVGGSGNCTPSNWLSSQSSGESCINHRHHPPPQQRPPPVSFSLCFHCSLKNVFILK